jgi:hypothetical protein
VRQPIEALSFPDSQSERLTLSQANPRESISIALISKPERKYTGVTEEIFLIYFTNGTLWSCDAYHHWSHNAMLPAKMALLHHGDIESQFRGVLDDRFEASD